MPQPNQAVLMEQKRRRMYESSADAEEDLLLRKMFEREQRAIPREVLSANMLAYAKYYNK